MVVGKLIVYASRSLIAPSLASLAAGPHTEPFAIVADRPVPGTPIGRGHPVCTVLAGGKNMDECRRILIERARGVQRLLNDC